MHNSKYTQEHTVKLFPLTLPFHPDPFPQGANFVIASDADESKCVHTHTPFLTQMADVILAFQHLAFFTQIYIYIYREDCRLDYFI